jgi:hypothetical protein
MRLIAGCCPTLVGVFTSRPGLFAQEYDMDFKLVRAEYDRETERAYVELRARDDDGGDAITTAIFSFKTTATLSKRQVEQDIVRKARHLLKRAAVAT